MQLEQQIAKLAEFGFELNAGITIEDILYSFPRDEYEEEPFDLILFVFGSEVEREPWGRSVCSRVWNFDLECIESSGDYVRIVQRLCQVTGQPDLLKNVYDCIDADDAWLSYEIDSDMKRWHVDIDNDWADTTALSYVMADIERDGKHFYFIDNGQAMLLFYLNETAATELNRLSKNPLKPVLVQ